MTGLRPSTAINVAVSLSSSFRQAKQFRGFGIMAQPMTEECDKEVSKSLGVDVRLSCQSSNLY